ncbi:MAG: hypothetical protein JWR26_3279 [Pedosphaera sp.]|nr:hypothetical protein [Pedosphaera sp.]
MKLNEWDQSAWFKNWMELARRSDASLALSESQPNRLREAAEKARQGMKTFIPPSSEWNFSMHESTAMRLPANGS